MKNRTIKALIIALTSTLILSPANAKTRSDYVNVPGTTLYIAPDVSQTNADKEIAIYYQLDPGIRQVLLNVGINYYVINEANDNTHSGHTGDTVFWGMGNYCWDNTTPLSTIFSEGRMSKDIKYGGTVMNHEIGHVIDALYNGGHIYETALANNGDAFVASNTPEWQNLYKQYKNTIADFGGLSKYEVYNAAEAFAESYGHYCKDPEKVRKAAPEIAAYIDAVNANVITYFAPEYYQQIQIAQR